MPVVAKLGRGATDRASRSGYSLLPANMRLNSRRVEIPTTIVPIKGDTPSTPHLLIRSLTLAALQSTLFGQDCIGRVGFVYRSGEPSISGRGHGGVVDGRRRFTRDQRSLIANRYLTKNQNLIVG
jgi:hypothetical protein